MKMKILVGSLALALSGSVFADTNVDTQTVAVSVPEVALLDVTDAAGGSATFTCTVADDEAGVNFTCVGANATGVIAVTANRASDGTGSSRTITAELGANLHSSWNFQITTNGGTIGTGVTGASVNSTTAVDVVTAIDNVAASDGITTYTLAPTATGIAMAYSGDGTTANDIIVTYTLGDDNSGEDA